MSAGLEATFNKRFEGGPQIRIDQFAVAAGPGVTVLFGPSGVGKTTVLRCLAGLERPDQGTIRFENEVWFEPSRGAFLPPSKRRLGFVPQEYALFPHLNVEQNIAYGLRELPAADRQTRLSQTLDWLELEPLAKRQPRELSGGQQQRVALARAVARRPKLLLLDEPLSALDSPTRVRLRAELRQLLLQLAVPAILVTHDRNEALALGDQIAVMDAGAIVQQGRVDEVFSHPANVQVAGIVAVETVQPGRVIGNADGLVAVAIGQQKLTALAKDLPPDTTDVYVCIRAENVILVKGEAPQSSPRNSLEATVLRLTHEVPLVRVDLDCGFPLLAFLTRQACEELALRDSDRVRALIKAPHIHLIPRRG
jgi:molybdate transport system ATP-binding protein